MNRPPSSPSPMAEALNWVSRISTVGAVMVLPMIGGRWLDHRFGTAYWSPLGLVVGLVFGSWQIWMIAVASQRQSSSHKNVVKKSQSSSDSEPNT